MAYRNGRCVTDGCFWKSSLAGLGRYLPGGRTLGMAASRFWLTETCHSGFGQIPPLRLA